MAKRYNRILSNRYYEVLDFINLHYCMTKRTDTAFWQEVQKSERINPRLQAKLDFWRVKPPSSADFEDANFAGMGDTNHPAVDTAALWNHQSYECILYGMEFLSEECDQRYGTNRPPMQIHPAIIQRLQAAKAKLPPHAQWLKQVVGMPDYPTKAKPAGWV